MRLGSRRLLPRRLGPTVVSVTLAATLGASGVVAVTGLPTGAPDADLATLAVDDERRAAARAAVAPVPVEQAASRSRRAAVPAEPAAPAPAAPSAPAVAPLGTLRTADLLVRLPATLTNPQREALADIKGVTAVAALDTAEVTVGAGKAQLVGVDPSVFRAFTPKVTAASDALWQAVARAELVPSYAVARGSDLPLGKDVDVAGTAVRVGAIAELGVQGVDVVTDRQRARALGAVPANAVLLAAPERGVDGLRKAVRTVLGKGVEVEVLRAEPVKTVARSGGKPTTYRELYIDSARYCPQVSWTVLAAIGQIESGHGKNMGPSSAGALGPMQFMPATWAAYGVDGDGDRKADIMNPYDAVPSAALYLCRHGARHGTAEGLYDAVFAYNHADWYVRKVLALAERYR